MPTRGTHVFAISNVRCRDKAHATTHDCSYRVGWVINPHMRVGAADPARALRQHRDFRAALLRADAELLELPFVHGAFDSVFAKDSALLVETSGVRRALLAHPRHAQRQREQTARARELASLGFDVHGPPRMHWEGGDVVMLPGARSMLFGYGPRSEKAAAAWLAKRTEIPVVPLKLRDPRLFHLDMALTILDNGVALVCRSALTDESFARLHRLDELRAVVPIPESEALAFGLNMVCVRGTVVFAAQAPFVHRVVRDLGYRAMFVPLDEFHHAGGSAACLVARLHRRSAAAPASAA